MHRFSYMARKRCPGYVRRTSDLAPASDIRVVLRHTLAVVVDEAELGLGAGHALPGGLAVPLRRLGIVTKRVCGETLRGSGV